jgi:ribokinase
LPPELTVVGSINMDLVARCDHLPQPGETVTGAEFFRAPGGKGANQAVAAARLGARVQMHGLVGGDANGTELIMALEEARVDAGPVGVADEPTGVALILVDAAGENQIVVAPGANASMNPASVRFEEHDAVLCQLEIPVEVVAEAARQCKGMFALNAAPAKPVPEEVLGRADLVVVNRYELDALPEAPRLTALTLGEEGAVLLEDGKEVARAAPPRVTAVDGTAAGDAFTACLVVSLLEDSDREEALRRACAAGAIAASRPGAQPSLPTAAEVDEILRA